MRSSRLYPAVPANPETKQDSLHGHDPDGADRQASLSLEIARWLESAAVESAQGLRLGNVSDRQDYFRSAKTGTPPARSGRPAKALLRSHLHELGQRSLCAARRSRR